VADKQGSLGNILKPLGIIMIRIRINTSEVMIYVHNVHRNSA